MGAGGGGVCSCRYDVWPDTVLSTSAFLLFFSYLQFGHGEVKVKSSVDKSVAEGSSSSSRVHVPIVAKDLTRGRSGYRQALEQAQDASVVETHLRSKKIPEGTLLHSQVFDGIKTLVRKRDWHSSTCLFQSIVAVKWEQPWVSG